MMMYGSIGAEMRVLYVVTRFPAYDLSFITQEIYGVHAHDPSLRVYSLYPSTEPDPHGLRLPRPGWPSLLKGLARWRAWPLWARLAYQHGRRHWKAFGLAFVHGLYVAEICRREGITHLHSHFATQATVTALVAAHLAGIGYSVTPHAFDLFTPNPALGMTLGRARACVAVSHYHVAYLRDHWPDIRTIWLVYYGVDTSFFQPPPTPRHAPADEIWRVVCVARLVPKKGHLVLIDALALLQQRGITVHLALYGDGPERPSIEARIAQHGLADRITLYGQAPPEVIRAAYHKAHVFALACRRAEDGDQDGLPTVLIEALATALPCVSTHITGVPDLLEDGVTGRCVAPDDPRALAEALADTFADYEGAQAMAAQGVARVQSSFESQHNGGLLWAHWQQTAHPG